MGFSLKIAGIQKEVIPIINLTKNGGEGYFRVTVDNKTSWTSWLTNADNGVNTSVTQGNLTGFEFNLTGIYKSTANSRIGSRKYLYRLNRNSKKEKV